MDGFLIVVIVNMICAISSEWVEIQFSSPCLMISPTKFPWMSTVEEMTMYPSPNAMHV